MGKNKGQHAMAGALCLGSREIIGYMLSDPFIRELSLSVSPDPLLRSQVWRKASVAIN